MIAAARSWLGAVTAVTLLLAAVRILVPAGMLRETASFIGGLILLLALLRPFSGWRLDADTLDFSRYQQLVEQRQAELETQERQARFAIIEERLSSYISDKAQALGLDVRVRAVLREGADNTPEIVRVEITGARSEALARWLETELGLPAEGQVWNEG